MELINVIKLSVICVRITQKKTIHNFFTVMPDLDPVTETVTFESIISSMFNSSTMILFNSINDIRVHIPFADRPRSGNCDVISVDSHKQCVLNLDRFPNIVPTDLSNNCHPLHHRSSFLEIRLA